METQRRTIIDQFTRQASGFASAPAINDANALQLLLTATHAGPADAALDVACGPGVVVCAFAAAVRHATGVDLVPAMIERARALQRERQLGNVSWAIADVTALPYADASFSIVTSRYAFHHMEQPRRVLAEMKRVCARGGAVALADVAASEDPRQAACFNRLEKLRDPSHVRALPLSEMKTLFADAGLGAPAVAGYRLELELESFLERSFPHEADAAAVRAMIVAAIDNDEPGINARREGDAVRLGYPVAILVSRAG